MEDFLSTGVTTAVLNETGIIPVRSDVLHRAQRNGERRSRKPGNINIVYWGGGADCVMLRTFSTLEAKKAEKSCGENVDEFGSLFRPRTVSDVCQRRAGLVELTACDC